MNVKSVFLTELSHRVEEMYFSLKNFTWSRTCAKPSEKMIVHIVEKGHFYSGGMADRFKGAVTAYAWSKINGAKFRMKYVYPFKLEDYLEPAEYDWRLKDDEYSECIRDVRVLYGRGEPGRRLMRLRTRRQVHYYGNMNCLEYIGQLTGKTYSWGNLYKELFRPGKRLEECLQEQRKAIGTNEYISAVFRFQNMLGDFKEYSFKSLETESAREQLIEKCLDAVKKLAEQYPGKRILVTSDSATFLSRVSAYGFVYVIPGRVVHLGSEAGEEYDVYMKSFIDFYMLSESTHVYCIGTSEMYPSEFPMYAARINDVPFERILI